MSKEPGMIHGAIFRDVFGVSVRSAKVVGEGFAIRSGKFQINSGVFNSPRGSVYHDRRRRMHELSEHCVRKVVEYWKIAGPAFAFWRPYRVKELLKDFDFS